VATRSESTWKKSKLAVCRSCEDST
jgi:hypothetical protein